jgi:hypothetical protein
MDVNCPAIILNGEAASSISFCCWLMIPDSRVPASLLHLPRTVQEQDCLLSIPLHFWVTRRDNIADGAAAAATVTAPSTRGSASGTIASTADGTAAAWDCAER